MDKNKTLTKRQEEILTYIKKYSATPRVLQLVKLKNSNLPRCYLGFVLSSFYYFLVVHCYTL